MNNLLIFSLSAGVIVFCLMISLSYFINQRMLQKPMPRIRVNPKAVNSNWIAITLSILVFISVVMLFKNIVPALLAVIIIIMLPSQILYWQKKRTRKQSIEHLATAVHLFSSEYVISKSIPRSLQVAGQKTPGNVGKAFMEAYTELAFQHNPADVYDRLAAKLKLSYGHMFAQLLKICQKQGTVIIHLFHDLTSRITAAQEKENLKTGELTADRYFNIILLLVPIPEFLMLRAWIPEINSFIFHTWTGLLIFTGWLVAIIVWTQIDRIVME